MLLARPLRTPLTRFLLLGLGVYLVWFVVYDLWLLPDGRLDEAVAQSVAVLSGRLMRLLGYPATWAGRVVRLPGVPGVTVEDGCNGLSTLGLFVGFVLAYPGPWRLRGWVLALGMVVIYLVNVGRVALLLGLQAFAPRYFDLAHEVAGTSVFYLVVFLLWLVWMRMSDARRALPSGAGVA